MPVFQDKFFLWGLSVFLGSLAGHSFMKSYYQPTLGILLILSLVLLLAGLKDRKPLRSMVLVCGFLLLVGFCRTVNWKQKTPDIISKISNIGTYNSQNDLIGVAQIQGLRWGGVEIFCIEGSPGMVGQSLVLYDQKIPTSGWIKFKIRAPHPLAKRGLFAFYSVSTPVKPEGLIVWLMEKRMVLRKSLIEGLNSSTQLYDSLRFFWSSAILRYDNEKYSQLKSDLRVLGLGAVFAVSGLHINLLAILIIGVLSVIPIGVRERWIFFIFFVILYASIVGFTASVFRALCFAFLIKTGSDNGLSSRNIRLLSAVFLIHILCFPSEVLEAGFLLSYGLTFLLVFLGSSFSMKTFANLFFQGICIQILLIPYLLWQFGEYPLMHFACVFLAPIFSVILALGFFVIFFSLFSSELATGILIFTAPMMESFVNLCSQWGQQSQWLLVPTGSFDGRLILLFYATILLFMMRVNRLKINSWQKGVGRWEAFLRKNSKQPYELHSSVYEDLFNESYEPAAALKNLHTNATIRNWNFMAFAHLYQAWVKHGFENTINPIRLIVSKQGVNSKQSLEPLFAHYLEGKLHLQWSKQNVLRLSGWLLHLELSSESYRELRQHREALQSLVDCRFLRSPWMRFLGSSNSAILNRLPVYLKNLLVNHLMMRLLYNST